MRPFFYAGALFIALVVAPFIGLYYSPTIPLKPNFAAIKDFSDRQQVFVRFMLPKIDYSNSAILGTRNQISTLVQTWQTNGALSYSDRAWLHEIADVYQLPDFSLRDPASIKELLSRLDEVPSSLVLAQAANESGWGISRFAVKADNFFGQHCNVTGCGIVPFGRASNESYEVKKFKNVQSAIDDYLYNLNTNPSYAEFRAARAQMRNAQEPLAGFRLAPYLVNYSILGKQYALIISAIIINHNLMQYDTIDSDNGTLN